MEFGRVISDAPYGNVCSIVKVLYSVSFIFNFFELVAVIESIIDLGLGILRRVWVQCTPVHSSYYIVLMRSLDL